MCKVPKFADVSVISLGGRPSTYSEVFTTAICNRISEGRSLRQACLAPGMPSKATVMRWLAAPANEAFRRQYRIACWIREMEVMDDILAIADDTSRDIIYDSAGRPRPNMAAIRRDELRIKVRMWLISIWEPKKYGPQGHDCL